MQKDSQILQKQPDSDMWTSLVEDFRVKTSVLPENVKVLRESAPGCGVRCTELYGKLDLNTSSLKIRQLSLFPVSNKSYATFPKSGIMRNGNVYQTTLLDTHTKGKDFILLPTPTKSDYKATFANVEALTRYLNSGHQIRVSDILAQKGYTCAKRILEIPAHSIVRNDDGFPDWSHRVGSIGNAVNPTVAKYLFECIKIFDKQLA